MKFGAGGLRPRIWLLVFELRHCATIITDDDLHRSNVQDKVLKMSKSDTTPHKIPHKALVVVADGRGARLFRNSGNESKIALSAEGEFKPSALNDDGPAGKRPPERSRHEMDEATFAKQLANELYRRAHSGDFSAVVLIADPQTLGEIRPCLHKEVESRLVVQIGKTLTKASIADIQDALK
jgi:protein required for attachment to host cells